MENNEKTKREKFLESIKAPTKEELGGREVDYGNVFLNAKVQGELYRREIEKNQKF